MIPAKYSAALAVAALACANGAYAVTFGSPQLISTAADGASWIFVADIDGDGDLDLVTGAFTNNKVAWFENRLDEATNDFAPLQLISNAPGSVTCVSAGDLDGDNDMDVVVSSYSDNRISWFENRLNEVTADFGAMQTLTTSAGGARGNFLADLDGDLDIDVVYAASTVDVVGWFENRLNEGSNDFAPSVTIATVPDSPSGLYCADIDGDLDLDVLSASTVDDRVAWYENRLNEVTADFASIQTIATTADGALSVWADNLDGDGDNDVLAAGPLDGTIEWYENRLDEVTTDFASALTVDASASGATSVITADLDGDGDPDILAGTSNTDRIYWYENRLQEGPADIAARVEISAIADGVLRVATGDLDGDGDIDVVSASAIGDQVHWIENLRLSPEPLLGIDNGTSDPLTLAFGSVELGAPAADLSALVTNLGVFDLLTTATVTNDGGGAFALTASAPSSLDGGSTGTMTVSFAPSALGPFVGEVSIESNTSSGTVLIALSGTGIDTTDPVSAVTGPTGTLTQPSAIFDVTYAADDGAGSGVASVELFYQRDGGGYVSYGAFGGSPISFDTTGTGGSGTYDFYTLATDNASNVETAPGSADASVVFDDVSVVTDWAVLND